MRIQTSELARKLLLSLRFHGLCGKDRCTTFCIGFYEAIGIYACMRCIAHLPIRGWMGFSSFSLSPVDRRDTLEIAYSRDWWTIED